MTAHENQRNKIAQFANREFEKKVHHVAKSASHLGDFKSFFSVCGKRDRLKRVPFFTLRLFVFICVVLCVAVAVAVAVVSSSDTEKRFRENYTCSMAQSDSNTPTKQKIL